MTIYRTYERTIYRSADSGRFVPKSYVESHPEITETEHRRVTIPVRSNLIFQTPDGGISIPAGQSKTLGKVSLRAFSKFRVEADERVGSASGVTIRLTVAKGKVVKTLKLTPKSKATGFCKVPGPELNIIADAAPGSGIDALDVRVYAS